MNEILNKLLLAVDKFMPEMHLRQSGFTYSSCGPFAKNKERMQKFKETGDSRYINQNKLDKAYFQDDMVYGDFKDLTRRTAPDKILRDKKHLILLKIRNMMDVNIDLLQWSMNCLIKNPLYLQINLLSVVVLKMRICQTSVHQT